METEIIKIKPVSIAELLGHAETNELLLETVRVWKGMWGICLEVVDGQYGCRRLVTELGPKDALKVARMLLNYALDEVFKIANRAEEEIGEKIKLLVRKLEEIRLPKIVKNEEEVRKEVQELAKLYEGVMNRDEVIKASTKINMVELEKVLDIASQILDVKI